MLKKYRNLWVFGDSYSTPDVCVSPRDSFWMQVARQIDIEYVYNYSWPCNSFDSVVHTLISDSDQYDWQQDFFLVGVPPLVRLTVVSKDDKRAYHRRVFDLESNEIEQQQLLCHHGLENLQFYNDYTAIRFEDPTWTEIQACRSIFLLNSWLDSKNSNYLIINLSKSFQNDNPSTGKFLLDQCLNHPRNILIDGTYHSVNFGVNKPADYDQYGWDGHHGAAGNKHFFEKSLLPKLKEFDLC